MFTSCIKGPVCDTVTIGSLSLTASYPQWLWKPRHLVHRKVIFDHDKLNCKHGLGG